ncbi:hypothetical protein ANN_27176 [Periplaneta americana]|uniref:Uncharacterized protein n=1 Tax=Periplaneta americana TaxID=6978 RepID=A0ABQ8RXL1_PERAM|nr:hypothetical protein ANN_27176 [Periplaneta americana]
MVGVSELDICKWKCSEGGKLPSPLLSLYALKNVMDDECVFGSDGSTNHNAHHYANHIAGMQATLHFSNNLLEDMPLAVLRDTLLAAAQEAAAQQRSGRDCSPAPGHSMAPHPQQPPAGTKGPTSLFFLSEDNPIRRYTRFIIEWPYPFAANTRNPVKKASYNGWKAHRANHTIPPFWLDDRPPLLLHVDVRPAAG